MSTPHQCSISVGSREEYTLVTALLMDMGWGLPELSERYETTPEGWTDICWGSYNYIGACRFDKGDLDGFSSPRQTNLQYPNDLRKIMEIFKRPQNV